MKVPVLGWTIDERFLLHRLRSTSIGGIAGVVLAAAFFFFHFFRDHIVQWELFAVIVTAAVVKIAVLIWYRLND